LNRRISLLLVVAAIGTVIWVNAGSLTPPAGPVAPTMKTLVEVEPRIIVNGLPGGGTYKHGITQSGSYYLTEDIVSTAAGETGILISADNVTLDLNGFTLIGADGGGGAGIAVNGTHINLAIRNGTIRDWGGDGIDLDKSANVQIEGLRISNNNGAGLRGGSAARVTGCNAYANAGDGFVVGNESSVIGNLSQFNARSGIHVAGRNNYIDGNHCGNNNIGIEVVGNANLIVRNVVRPNNTADFSVAAGNDYGQIIANPGANFVATNPWANFATCPPPQTACSGLCVDLGTDPANCGSCGNACPNPPNATSQCLNGTCATICNEHFADCNNNPFDGCEANTQTDTNHCGTCNAQCVTGQNQVANCVNGTCQVSCSTGYGDCDGNPLNGCETNTTNTANHCGACNNMCPGGANATGACVNSVCTLACTSGFGDCNGNNADGCETNLNTNLNNCGGCGVVCPDRPNSSPVCSAGFCNVSCDPGFLNCNGNPFDGCEINRLTDDNNCGTCGNSCNIFQDCINGVCQAPQ
jgi:hypothetical protein